MWKVRFLWVLHIQNVNIQTTVTVLKCPKMLTCSIQTSICGYSVTWFSESFPAFRPLSNVSIKPPVRWLGVWGVEVDKKWRRWKCMWTENGGDENGCEMKNGVINYGLINLKPIWLKQSWYDENRAMFHQFPPLIFIIHHSQHKIASHRLRKVASRVEVTKNNW